MYSPILSALLDLTSVRLMPETDMETCFIPLTDGLGVWYADPGRPLCVVTHITPKTMTSGMPSEKAAEILSRWTVSTEPLVLPGAQASFVSLAMLGDPAGLPAQFSLRCSHGERWLATGEPVRGHSHVWGFQREVVHSGASLMQLVRDMLGQPTHVRAPVHEWALPMVQAM